MRTKAKPLLIHPRDARNALAEARMALEALEDLFASSLAAGADPQAFIWARLAQTAAWEWRKKGDRLSASFAVKTTQERLAEMLKLATWACEAATEARRILETYR